MSDKPEPRRRGRRRNTVRRDVRAARSTEHHRSLEYPFEADRVLSDDEVAHIHEEAKRLLQEHGIRFLLDDARRLLIAAGAELGVGHDDRMVRLPAELVDEALAAAPAAFTIRGTRPGSEVDIGGRRVALLPVGGAPFVSDLERGRRPGTLQDYENFTRLTQAFDVLHANSPTIEAQDVPIQFRHMEFVRTQILNSSKVPFVYTRGRRRIADSLEMLRINAGLTADELRDTPVCFSIVNTNSPRQIDVPMAGGIIDMARAGQPCVLTPFTLAGAMAPVSLAGALLLQHAEALAAITLSQVARPGAPVVYGAFTSNVDMKSGSPAFGTPEAMRAAIASGQLARHIGLPWRSSGSSASPVEDAQGAWETVFNLHGAMRGGSNFILHSAGWQEGGLVASYEKFILDVEILQTIADSWRPIDTSPAELAFDVIAGVDPGAHFFGEDHTLERFATAFREPIVATRKTFEQWTEEGRRDARSRAADVWKHVLAETEPPALDESVRAEIVDFVERRRREGGAPVD